jgi:hypothetical protein
MMTEDEIREAVEIQRRCYGLLAWLEAAIQKGFTWNRDLISARSG